MHKQGVEFELMVTVQADVSFALFLVVQTTWKNIHYCLPRYVVNPRLFSHVCQRNGHRR